MPTISAHARLDMRRFGIDGDLLLPPHFDRRGRRGPRACRWSYRPALIRRTCAGLRRPVAVCRDTPAAARRTGGSRIPRTGRGPERDRCRRGRADFQSMASGTWASSCTSCRLSKACSRYFLRFSFLAAPEISSTCSRMFSSVPYFSSRSLGRLGADQRHAGHVVGRIADQGLVVDHLVAASMPHSCRRTSRSISSFLRML